MPAGTFQLEDLLNQRFSDVPAQEFGFDRITDAISERETWLNAQVDDQIMIFAETSPDSGRVWGGDAQFHMTEVGELGVADAEKARPGTETYYPLRKFSQSTGWTADYLLNATVQDMAIKAIGMQNAYLEMLQSELAFAIYNNGNYTFVDKFGDGLTKAVKCFLNADGVVPPSAPDGTTFLGTHNHYNGSAAFSTSDVDAAISHITEHGLMKGLKMYVPFALIATLEGLASTKFVKNVSSVLQPASTTLTTTTRSDPEADLANMFCGWWDGRVPVYSRSWCPTGMLTVVATGAAQKPLVHRVHKNSTARGLIRVAPYGLHPINSQTMEAYVGFGAWNRAAVAVLDTANAAYTEPTLIR